MIKYLTIRFLLFFTPTAFGQSNHDFHKFIDSVVTEVLKTSQIRSLSIGIIEDGKTQIRYYGDTGNGKKPAGNNYFEIASITKTFTGLLLAQAVFDNKLHPDDDIRKYLDGDYSNLQYEGMPITFRHLATHMNGLPYSFPIKPEIFVSPDYDELPFILDSLERNYMKQDFFKDLRKVKIDTMPGQKFSYSNVGANLVAYLLENIYKMSYDQLLQKYVFKKANMINTKLSLNKKEEHNLIVGYNTKKVKMPFFSQSMRAAGALKSTVPDMMKYISLQLKESDAVIRVSHESIWSAPNSKFSMGYFWQMDENSGNKKIFQNGGSFGTSGWIEFYPDTKMGFFLITNISGPNVHSQLSALTLAIYNEFLRWHF